MYCYSSLFKQEGAISTYQVDDEITIYDDMIKEVRFHVYFNEEECEVQCTCSLFKSKGILCRGGGSVEEMVVAWRLGDFRSST